MKRTDHSFLSSDGITDIHYVKWLPDSGQVKGLVMMTHGIVDYIMRYDEFTSFLADNGYAVFGHDHLGHGKSVKSMDDLGYVADRHSRDILVDDMYNLYTIAKREYPDIPTFWVAHSMGSYMLRNLLACKDEKLSKAVIMGTGYINPFEARCGIALVNLIALFRGWHHRSKMLDNMTFSGPYKKFDLTGKDPSRSWLSKNVDSVVQKSKDPLVNYVMTLSGFRCLFDAVYFSCQKKNVAKIRKNLPIMLISGQDDPVGDMSEGVKTVYRLLKETGHEDVTLSLFENDRHEILMEIDREEVFKTILDFIEKV